jgi:hypothetical protein
MPQRALRIASKYLDLIGNGVQITVDQLLYPQSLVFVSSKGEQLLIQSRQHRTGRAYSLVNERRARQAVQEAVVTIAPQGSNIFFQMLLRTFDVLQAVVDVGECAQRLRRRLLEYEIFGDRVI